MSSFNFYLLSFLLTFTSIRGNGFEYNQQAKWYDDFQECSFTKQSPIELISDESIVSYDIPVLSFINYDTPYSVPVTIENNGHTANIALPKPTKYIDASWEVIDQLSPRISDGPLPGDSFITESVHFHWGSKDSHGSEHVIDSTRFSMEMHIVHRNGKYQTIEEARENEDGLAVVSIIYNVDSNATDFAGLSGVITALKSITVYEKLATINHFSLSALFGNLDKNEFFTYQGSLTTPPCSQAVTWVVFSKPISITHEQMTEFHLLVDDHGDVLENNYRSLQSKGHRKVTLRKSVLKTIFDALRNVSDDED